MARLLSAIFAVFLLSTTLAAAGQAQLRVGSDISYAPLEYYAPGTKRVEGFDYDLAQAIARKLGARADFDNHNFDDLLHALRARKYDIVMSAMNDTRERMKQADFIDYFLAGSGILVAAGNPHHIYNLASLCGMTVDVQRGSAQESAIREQSKKCQQAGLHAIAALSYATDAGALQQFVAGKSVAHISDYPVVAHLARTLGGGKAYGIAGRQFGVVPYGIAVAKDHPALRKRVQDALKGVIADGTYDALLKKWGLEQGAMRSAPIDAGTKFQ